MSLRSRGSRRAAAALLAAAAGIAVAGAAPAGARLRWAPAASAPIHPGVKVSMGETSCVAGLVLHQRSTVYLAVPASCAGVSVGARQDGCSSAQYPLGVPVTIAGARHHGTLAYSSWVQMQSAGVRSSTLCNNNDLALVRLDPRDVARTNPSVPVVGGPQGTATSSPAQGAQLTLYATSAGKALATTNSQNGWDHQMVPAAPITAAGVGGPVLTSSGQALGMVSIVPSAPGGPVEVHDLLREVRYLQQVPGFHHVHVVSGTVAFTG